MSEALRRQQQRGLALRRLARVAADRWYDPDAALLRRFNPYVMRFTGHTVAQRSLDYAILLLHSDDRMYGSDDAVEANRIIQTILRYQDLRKGSDTHGNFFWMTHWDHVKDKNAVSFLSPALSYTYLTFADKLWDDTKSALLEAFPHMITGLRNHRARWQYTNIFFLNLGGLVSIATVLGDQAVHEEAAELFDEWLAGTSGDGFHEFNSPVYSAVSLYGLEAAWAHTPDPQFRARLERTLDVLTYQMALNLLPNGFLGGSYARTNHVSITGSTSVSSLYSHVKFGTPLRSFSQDLAVGGVTPTMFDYVPPPVARNLALNERRLTEIRDQVLSLGSARTHTITPKYSIASQTIEEVGGKTPPPYVMLARNVSSPRCSTPILPDESFSLQPCAVFEARQEGSRVLGRLHYELADENRTKFLADHTFRCEPRVLFGRRGEDIREVWVGNVDWAGRDVRLQPGQPLAVSYGDVALGVVALPVDRISGKPQHGHLNLSYGDDGELRLSMSIFGGPDLDPDDEPLDVILLVDATDDVTSAEEYATWLTGWQLSRRTGAGTVTFMAEHPDGTLLNSASEPIHEPNVLHTSPHLVLKIGDLQKLVVGEVDNPFRVTAES